MNTNLATVALAIALATSLMFPISANAKGSSKSGASGGSHSVRGYTKKDGTYVVPHRQTNPDGSKRNNYSSKGNVNLHTGKEGTKDPDKP